ncbi:MAG: nucleotide exchange factor GrpE [Acidimicrobiales bacterium]
MAEARAAEEVEVLPTEVSGELEEAEAAVVEDLTELAAERDGYLDQLRRITADFDNYRKRMLKQQSEQVERAAEGLVEKLLDVLDTFDMALAHGEGFDQVHGRLMGVLGKEGLERIDPAGEPFDPNVADAVAHEDADEGPLVAEVLRAGYRWKGRVLRPAMVKVRG